MNIPQKNPQPEFHKENGQIIYHKRDYILNMVDGTKMTVASCNILGLIQSIGDHKVIGFQQSETFEPVIF